MKKLVFHPNPKPTLGVELELGLVDAETLALRSAILDVLDALPADFSGSVKPELMQCYLEINTGICRTVSEAEKDLTEKVRAVQEVCDRLGLRLLWSGTHPFSLWQDQQPSPSERYKNLLQLLQDMGRQLITFGLHVHVGVDSGDKAIQVCERIMTHLPTLLALSCNSPCWENRITGLQSSRSKIMENLPTAGLPSPLRNWSEYTWLINHLIETGFINSIREIWWDVRPHHNFGTVEVRVCDIPGDLETVMQIVALVQCLVVYLSDEIDEGTYQATIHPMMVRQNKWRACRFGLRAQLVEPVSYRSRPVPAVVEMLVDHLTPVARRLGCQDYLRRLPALAEGKSWADRQLAALEAAGSPPKALVHLTELSRL